MNTPELLHTVSKRQSHAEVQTVDPDYMKIDYSLHIRDSFSRLVQSRVELKSRFPDRIAGVNRSFNNFKLKESKRSSKIQNKSRNKIIRFPFAVKSPKETLRVSRSRRFIRSVIAHRSTSPFENFRNHKIKNHPVI